VTAGSSSWTWAGSIFCIASHWLRMRLPGGPSMSAMGSEMAQAAPPLTVKLNGGAHKFVHFPGGREPGRRHAPSRRSDRDDPLWPWLELRPPGFCEPRFRSRRQVPCQSTPIPGPEPDRACERWDDQKAPVAEVVWPALCSLSVTGGSESWALLVGDCHCKKTTCSPMLSYSPLWTCKDSETCV